MTNIIYWMNPEEEMKRAIMRRVRVIYYLRKLSSPLFLETFLFAVLGCTISLCVSVPSVIANLSRLSLMEEGWDYMYFAAMHTTHFVQVVLVATAILLMFMIYGILRSLGLGRVFVRGGTF